MLVEDFYSIRSENAGDGADWDCECCSADWSGSVSAILEEPRPAFGRRCRGETSRCRAGRVTLLSTKPNFISAFSPLRASARQASLASRAKAGGRYHSNLCQRIAADLIEGSPALFLDNLNNTAFKSDLLASVGAMREEDRPPAYGRRTPRLRPRVLRFVSCLRGPVLISSTAICPRVDRTL
jgi:hypothetical protein